MAAELVQIERHENYAIFTLNRPEKRNALSVALLQELDHAIASVEEDKEIRAVILRAAGGSFCSGIDLAEAERLEGGQNLATIFTRLENLPVPTIAAVQGAALAGGCELALHCDLRIAGEDVRIGMTPARVGLIVPYDFIRKIIEVAGAANTARIIFTAEAFDGPMALKLGLVHEVVPNAKLNATAVEWAERISSNAPLSLRTMKKSLRRSMSTAFDAWHDDILELGRAVRRSLDAKEGIRAFLEKRKPRWRAE